MSEIQFEVTTDLATIANTQIETNFEAVKAWLTEELEPYASMVVTPGAIADAKKTRATLNKVKAGIDAQRKSVKKEWMKPLEDYEAKCKELTGIVDNASSNIDGQIKEMENAEKEAKRGRLEQFFNEHSADISEYIKFSDLFDSKWLNATFSEIDAANSIEAGLEDIRDGLDAIRGMESPYEAAMLSEYSKSHNLSKALAEGKRLESIQKAEEERKAREAEAKAAEQAMAESFSESAVEPVEPEYEPVAPPPYYEPPIRPMEDEPPKPKVHTLRFEVTLTRDQAFRLKDFFQQNGIKYKKF